jgi:hypothetical protein
MYYPKSQITPNQHTNGGEYITSNTKEDYKGYYYIVSNGNRYTGKTPEDGFNILLIEQIPTENNNVSDVQYITVNNFIDDQYITKPISSRYIPKPISPTQPQVDTFVRYFCKKNNELKYMEIDKQTYDLLKSKDNQIAWDLYSPSELIWQNKGEKDKTYTTNKNMVMLVEKNQNWYGFNQYFKDNYLKYYLGI